jgi:hypothetical protein
MLCTDIEAYRLRMHPKKQIIGLVSDLEPAVERD